MNIFLRAFLMLAAALWATVAAAQSEYRIRSGDTLNIEVLEDPGLNRSVVVLPDGRFSFPLAGSIVAGGRTVAQVQAEIASSIAGNFANDPNVFVGVQPAPREPRAPVVVSPAAPPTISIYVMGEVQKNGLIAVKPGTTFLQALAQAGGLTPFAATKRVQLRRTNPATRIQKVYSINYRALMNGAQLNRDVRLIEGDVILVPERRLFE